LAWKWPEPLGRGQSRGGGVRVQKQAVKGTYLPMKMEQNVPKRRHIKFRSRGITQKKAYSIRDKATV